MSDAGTIELSPPTAHPHRHHAFTLALVGNPNAGKTTLFNALTGLRAKTGNFPGTTVERKVGRLHLDHRQLAVVDLPGLYSLDSTSPDEKIASDALQGRLSGHPAPDAVLIVVDATNLERNLFLVSQVLELDRPVLVALNMMDMARRDGIHIDVEKLRRELGCPVIPVSARNAEGIDALRRELARLVEGAMPEAVAHCKPNCGQCAGCPFQARYEWTEAISVKVMDAAAARRSRRTEKIDEVLTHPVGGLFVFFAVMIGLFTLIFAVADIPMGLIEGVFANLGEWVRAHTTEGDWQSFLVNGVIGGLSGVLVFLPQICILSFALTMLEDTGYLARAALVVDRYMQRLGLPGKAFIPLLSAHACAIPAIVSTRVIENARDRLLTILITPLMTCSARIPVYVMVVALLFPDAPLKAALVFVGAYATGITAAMLCALLFKKTILPGGSRPLVIELPQYRFPGMRTALLHTMDRAWLFIRQAGTVILGISLVMWALSTYPRSSPPAAAVTLQERAEAERQAGRMQEAVALEDQAGRLASQHALARSLAGRIGHAIEPVLRPLGFDWQIGIGIVSSFAAREVIVSTLSVIYGVGDDEDSRASLYDTLRRAKHPDGSPVFTTAACFSLLVFYILAAQCLATQAVVRRETGGWKWPLFQIAYMSSLAYVAALLTYQVLARLGYA